MRKSSAASDLTIACLLAGAPLHAQQGAPEDATLALPGTAMTFVPAYVAEDMGLFAKQGLRVKSVVITGIGSINAVIAGSADFGSVSGLSLTRAAAHGQRLIAIANTLTRPTVMLVMRKDLARELRSRRRRSRSGSRCCAGTPSRSISINSIIHAYVLLLGARAGVDLNEIRIAPMAPTAALSAFNTHQVDGFAMSMPWPLQPVLDGTRDPDRERRQRRSARHGAVCAQRHRRRTGDLREAQGSLHENGPRHGRSGDDHPHAHRPTFSLC